MIEKSEIDQRIKKLEDTIDTLIDFEFDDDEQGEWALILSQRLEKVLVDIKSKRAPDGN